jgi:hypothetical protein
VSKTYGFGQASDTTKRERRHKLQEYIRSTVAAFPPDGLPQPLLTFLGLKSYPVQRRTPSTASPANGSANSSSSTLGGSGGVAGAAGTSVPVTFTPTFTPRTDSDGYVLCGGGMAKFDAALPTEPDEAMREAIKLGDAMLCTQLLAAKVSCPHLALPLRCFPRPHMRLPCAIPCPRTLRMWLGLRALASNSGTRCFARNSW